MVSFNEKNEKTLSKSFSETIQEVYIGENKSSTISVIWNITNFIQGIGILGLPYAILMGSWFGVLLNIISGFICCSTGKMVIDCMYVEIDGRKFRLYNDYPDIGAQIWPKFGRSLVAILSVLDMYGAATLCLILLSSTLNIVFINVIPNFNGDYWFLIAALTVSVLLFITKLTIISKFSFLSITALFTAIISIFLYCFIKTTQLNIYYFPKLQLINIPISCGIIIFSYTAHPIFPAIETNMKKPEDFNKAINISFMIGTITKTIFGLIPVCLFGYAIKPSISDNITENDFYYYLIVKISVIINSFFSLPMIIYVISERLDQALLFRYFPNKLWPKQTYNFIWIFITRLLIIFLILLTALIVPYFALVMSFMGSLTATMLSFILPCWFSLVLKRNSLSKLQIIFRYMIIIFGIIAGLLGIVVSGENIINNLFYNL